MKIEFENIPPNSTIEFYNIQDRKYRRLPASINNFLRSTNNPILESMKHHTCYKIY